MSYSYTNVFFAHNMYALTTFGACHLVCSAYSKTLVVVYSLTMTQRRIDTVLIAIGMVNLFAAQLLNPWPI